MVNKLGLGFFLTPRGYIILRHRPMTHDQPALVLHVLRLDLLSLVSY